jgi:outer membrane protein OmpA-like peptidoglycan-associated protein
MIFRTALFMAAALLVLPGLSRAADPPYADAWDPAAQAAAEAAAAKLGPKRALDVVPSVLEIRGLQSGIVSTVQEVRQAMRDLGATETDLEVRVELPADVLFDFDKADIRSDAAQALAQLATLIRAYPSGSATLEGHTDSKGDDAYNQRLSEHRAESVERWLVEREGIDAGRLTPRGWGERKPVAGNEDDAGRQRNRRVEVVIRKQ